MSKLKNALLIPLLLLSQWSLGQNKSVLSLKEAIEKGLEVSSSLKAEKTNIGIAQSKNQSVKEARLPELGISGQLMYLPYAPNLNLKTQQQTGTTEGTDSPAAALPVPKMIAFGGLNASLPLFTGFKLKNSLIQSEQFISASEISADLKAENVAWQTLNLYFTMYKTEQMIEVLEENLARSDRRIIDYSNFVDNGIMPQNDLLKAKLQRSNVEISLEEAKSTFSKLQYKLNTWLQRDPDLDFQVELEAQNMPQIANPITGISNRKDLSLLSKQIEMKKTGVELSRSAFFPTIALTGGWLNAYVPNLVTVSNALNFGLAVKYNISSLYKNKSEVKTARLELQHAQQTLTAAEENARIEVNDAVKNYELTLKKQKVYEEALVQAKENLRIVTNKSNNGLADTDQLLEAELQELQSEINQKLGVSDQQIAWYQIQYTSGNLLNYLNINK